MLRNLGYRKKVLFSIYISCISSFFATFALQNETNKYFA